MMYFMIYNESMMYFTAPSAPYIRNVTVLTPNSVYLQWDPPSVFFRRIDKYVIKWWDTRGNDPDSMVPGTQTEVSFAYGN